MVHSLSEFTKKSYLEKIHWYLVHLLGKGDFESWRKHSLYLLYRELKFVEYLKKNWWYFQSHSGPPLWEETVRVKWTVTPQFGSGLASKLYKFWFLPTLSSSHFVPWSTWVGMAHQGGFGWESWLGLGSDDAHLHRNLCHNEYQQLLDLWCGSASER